MQAQTRMGNPALQNGLLFGIILGVLEVALSLTLGSIGFVICLVLYLGMVGFAGYRASVRTGKVSTGLVAGLFVGLFSSIIGSLGLFIFTLPHVDAMRQLLQQQANTFNQGITINYTTNVVIAYLVLLLVILIVGSSALALGIGAIGGAIGKGNAPAQLTQYPPYPYAGQNPAQSTQYPPYPNAGQNADPRYVPPPTDPRYMPPPAYPPQEYVPPQAYQTPQTYPPKPEDYMSPPQGNKQEGA